MKEKFKDMKSSLRDRAKILGKKFKKLNRMTRRKIYFTELLIKNDEKYWDFRIKHIFFYSLWTRKSVAQLKDRKIALEKIVADTEQFIEEYYERIKAWVK